MPIPPFFTSGASSRAHHAFVAKLDAVQSTSETDEIVRTELERCKTVLRRNATGSVVVETLVIVLHCSIQSTTTMATSTSSSSASASTAFASSSSSSSSALPSSSSVGKGSGEPPSSLPDPSSTTQSSRAGPSSPFRFALVPALHLAEGGKTLRERRVGYTVLTELMPPDDELGLMLVNTVAKDLGSTTISHVLLALGAIIAISTPYLAPAVLPALPHLVKHKSPLVRRRALVALSRLSPSLPIPTPRLLRCIARENDESVFATVVDVIRASIDAGGMGGVEDGAGLVGAVVEKSLRGLDSERDVNGNDDDLKVVAERNVLRLLLSASKLNMFNPSDPSVLRLVHQASTRPSSLIDCCALQATTSTPLFPIETVSRLLNPSTSSGITKSTSSSSVLASTIDTVGGGTGSGNGPAVEPGAHYLALRCLRLIEPERWQESLTEGQMATIMSGIHSLDSTIRRETTRLLGTIDPSLPSATISTLLSPPVSRTHALHALESILVASETSGDQGGDVARGLGRCVGSLGVGVWDDGITTVLEFLRTNTNLIAPFVSASSTDETSLTIVASCACEYTVPSSTASFLSSSLSQPLSPGVAEVVLVALVPLAQAGANAVEDAVDIDALKTTATEKVKKRRDQVITILERGLAGTVMGRSRSRALPDVLDAIVAVSREQGAGTPREPKPLRYT